MAITATSSPLTTAANNIVKIGLRSKNSLPRAQSEFESFSRFLTKERMDLERIELPSQKKVKELANKNIVSNFGSVGSLLSNLLSGAFDLGNFISGFFPGKGEKIGKTPSKTKPQPKPTVVGKRLRLGGLRALGIVNAAFAGLDFATGLAEGESVGKAGAGALGSLAGGFGGAIAGSMLAGAIGQALVPVPGLGFVLGAAVGSLGSFIGGYVADRAYEGLTGEAKKKQEAELKKSSERLKSSRSSSGYSGGFDIVLMEFNKAVEKFEDLAMNIGDFMLGGVDSYSYDEGLGTITAPPESTDPYDGPVDGESFYPLPGGTLTNRSVNIPGGEYGAFRAAYQGGHSGQDIGGLPGNSPVAAWRTGRLRYIGSVEPGDTILEIDHGGGYKSVYKHVIPTVPDGSIVYGGQQIAKLLPGKEEVRGRKYDTHLHFEVWKNGSHTNPNPYISKTQKIPRVLSLEKARENSEKNSSSGNTATRQEHGVNIYPQQTTPTPSTQSSTPTPSPRPATPSIPTPSPRPATSTPTPQPRPITQPLPQAVMASPPKEQPKIQSYPSYSQGQSYILERQTIIAMGNEGGDKQSPVLVPVGGGGGSNAPMIINGGGPSLNSIMKSILLTSLSSS